MNSHIFALDIGTRSVTGMLLEKDETEYTIKKHYVLEHKERSMLDGQIHNVVQVANVIQQQKYDIIRNDEILSLDSTLHINDELYIKERKRQSAIFQDIFRYIELDLTEANGRFTLLKNAEPTSFDSHITSGDILEIKWETS